MIRCLKHINICIFTLKKYLAMHNASICTSGRAMAAGGCCSVNSSLYSTIVYCRVTHYTLCLWYQLFYFKNQTHFSFVLFKVAIYECLYLWVLLIFYLSVHIKSVFTDKIDLSYDLKILLLLPRTDCTLTQKG